MTDTPKEAASPALEKAEKALPNFHRVLINVPVGHPLPLGKTVERAFNVTLEYGWRWHPEWAEPHVVITAYRFLPHGDALGFHGETVLAFPIPEDIAKIAKAHGLAWDEAGAAEAAEALAKRGLARPAARETMEAMIPQRASRLQ